MIPVYLTDYEKQVRSVACPYCGACSEGNCIDETTGTETRPHHARMVRYDRAQKESKS